MEFFAADDFDRGKADEEQDSGPDARDGMLLAAGFVPQPADQRNAAERGGSHAYQRDENEVGEPAKRERGLFGRGSFGACGRRAGFSTSLGFGRIYGFWVGTRVVG